MDVRRNKRRQKSVHALHAAASPMPAFAGLGLQSLQQGGNGGYSQREKPGTRAWRLSLLTTFTRSKLGHRLMRLERYLARKRFVSVLNLVVLVTLIWQAWSIVKQDGDLNLPNEVLNRMKLEELPYPLNLVVQVHRNNITLPPQSTVAQHAGYVRMQEGTFRNKYPSTQLSGSGTFDGVFVITSGKCERQWENFQKAMDKTEVTFSKWPMTDMKQISLTDPPIPISAQLLQDIKKASRPVISTLRRQLSYLDAHRRLWQHIVDTGKQRVLIMDTTLFPSERLLKSLPPFMTNADQESVARQKPWHYVFLRRQKVDASAREAIWTMNPVYNHGVTIANTSVGAGAYVVSIAGARFLLREVKRFRAPLDVEIGLLQHEFGAEFVALSGCNNDEVRAFCPEIVKEVADGGHGVDCTWRRVQERRAVSLFQGMF